MASRFPGQSGRLSVSAALALLALSLLWGGSRPAVSMPKSMPSPGAQPMVKDPAGSMPGVIAQGRFRMAEKPVRGGFSVHSEAAGQVLLLSRDFQTSEMAPDLKIVFSRVTDPLAGSPAPAYPLKPGSYTVLAPLKASRGGQRYTIPASIDLSQQGSVLIWCERFNATMAWAPLKG